MLQLSWPVHIYEQTILVNWTLKKLQKIKEDSLFLLFNLNDTVQLNCYKAYFTTFHSNNSHDIINVLLTITNIYHFSVSPISTLNNKESYYYYYYYYYYYLIEQFSIECRK